MKGLSRGTSHDAGWRNTNGRDMYTLRQSKLHRLQTHMKYQRNCFTTVLHGHGAKQILQGGDTHMEEICIIVSDTYKTNYTCW